METTNVSSHYSKLHDLWISPLGGLQYDRGNYWFYPYRTYEISFKHRFGPYKKAKDAVKFAVRFHEQIHSFIIDLGLVDERCKFYEEVIK